MNSPRFDEMARQIFEAAIREDRCGELLMALFQNGSATVQSGKLVISDLKGMR